MLTVFDDQVSLHEQITRAARSGRAQASLIQLIGHRLADALFGQVALDPRIIGTILQGGVFPAPAAIGGKIAAGVEVMIDLVAGAGTEKRSHSQYSETAEHDISPVEDMNLMASLA
ncbi:hypothetical protein PS662_03999 [Pseudomonas fluorescens]|uniref:Uncharacterized protein n=1 Tax=Pseudomonas fluorescens TaxID=294 RepID=A0A5E6VA05_PSEFL|nr:hypothetical protein PS662_03999 [Pseudomonas fluorescens]